METVIGHITSDLLAKLPWQRKTHRDQHRLAIEFALDKRRYVYKSGETDPKDDEGCSIIEATQALGSAHSPKVAVDIKREIGSIWANTDESPYIELFNENLTADKLWRSVLIMRAVDQRIQELRRCEMSKADLIGIHMNRIILHLVFKKIEDKLRSSKIEISELLDAVKIAVEPVFKQVSAYIDQYRSDEYLASLCKNHAKCNELVLALTTEKVKINDITNAMGTQAVMEFGV